MHITNKNCGERVYIHISLSLKFPPCIMWRSHQNVRWKRTDIPGIVDESELISVHRLVTAESLQCPTLVMRVNPCTSLVHLLQECLVCRLWAAVSAGNSEFERERERDLPPQVWDTLHPAEPEFQWWAVEKEEEEEEKEWKYWGGGSSDSRVQWVHRLWRCWSSRYVSTAHSGRTILADVTIPLA